MKCGSNVNYYKSVHHPIPTRGNREHPRNSQNKSVSSPFIWVSRYIFFLAKLKGRGRPFFKSARRGGTLWDYPQEHLVIIRVIKDETVSPFVKFEIILPLLCFSLDPHTNKHCNTWSSMINLSQPAFTSSKLKIETLEQNMFKVLASFWCLISHFSSSVSTVNFEHVIEGWGG